MGALLDRLEAEMSTAQPATQWTTNSCTSPFAPIWIAEMVRRQT